MSVLLCSCEVDGSQHGWLSSETRSCTNLCFPKQSAKLLSDANQSDSHIKTDPLEMKVQPLFWDCTNPTKSESECPKLHVVLGRLLLRL